MRLDTAVNTGHQRNKFEIKIKIKSNVVKRQILKMPPHPVFDPGYWHQTKEREWLTGASFSPPTENTERLRNRARTRTQSRDRGVH